MELTFKRMRLPGALALCRDIVRDFHAYELKGYAYALAEIVTRKAIAITVFSGGRRCGYLVHGLPDGQGMLRIMYLATEQRVRGHGIGAAILQKFCRDYPHATLYFEVEDPAFAQDEQERQLMEHRIGFYRRCGFSLLDFKLTAGPWHLFCMTNNPVAAGQIEQRYRSGWGQDVVSR